MDKYQTYTEFKSSGIEWIGPVPDHWGIKPLFGVASTESLKNETGEKTNVLSLSYGNIIRRDVEKNFGLLPESFNTYQLVSSGDLILRLTDLQNDKRSLRVGQAKEEGIITSAYLKLTAKNIDLDERYFYRLLHSYDTTKVFYGMGGGLRQSMKFEEMRRLPMLVPTLDEQQKIAIFLDHETAKIDTLIEKQQQLIKLLKEKRQSVISHAVTKGLNPNAPMRDSGVEWLGEVPEHWATLPLKLVVKTRKGVAFKSVDFCDNGIRVVKASDIKEKTIRATDVFLPQAFVKEYPKALLNSGDIILSTVGSNPDVRNSAVGQIGIVPADLYGTLLNQNTVVFDPNEGRVLREYLFYILQMEGYRDHLDLHAHGTANQSSLSIADMLNFNICFPPIAEQREICQHLLQQQKKLGDLESKSGNSGILLTERRTALISAAVTGKIDVRNWQAPETSNTNYKEVAA